MYTVGKHSTTEPHTQATFNSIVQAITYHLARDAALTSFHSRLNYVDLIHNFKFPVATLLLHHIYFVSYLFNYSISETTKPTIISTAHLCEGPGTCPVNGK